MDITERFLNYTKFDTQSAEDSESVPSTAKQLLFAEYLKKELEREGLEEVELDEKGYLYATLKSNVKGDIPTIGFISHYDTSPDCSGADIKPQIVRGYNGGDILLSEGIVMSPKKFPELSQHVGEDLIVTDGTTLLGADRSFVEALLSIHLKHQWSWPVRHLPDTTPISVPSATERGVPS